jgi:hypothetical protein
VLLQYIGAIFDLHNFPLRYVRIEKEVLVLVHFEQLRVKLLIGRSGQDEHFPQRESLIIGGHDNVIDVASLAYPVEEYASAQEGDDLLGILGLHVHAHTLLVALSLIDQAIPLEIVWLLNS